MRILTIGDTHCRTKFINEYLLNSKSIIEQAKTIQPDAIVMLGDDLHNHATAHSLQLTVVSTFIFELSKIAPVFKLIGNHEMVSPNSFLLEDHHFNTIKNTPNVTVVDKPMVINGVFLCPYVPKGMFNQTMTMVDMASVHTCFAHQEFRGVKVGNQESTSDDIWDASKPLMVSGHIHDKQILSDNLVYIGSPAQFTFADTEDKSIALIEDGVVSYIDVDYVRYKTLQIKTSDTVEYDPKNRNRIIVSGTLSELKAFRSSSFFKQAQKDGVAVVPKVVDEFTVSNTRKSRKTFSEIISSMVSDEVLALWETIK